MAEAPPGAPKEEVAVKPVKPMEAPEPKEVKAAGEVAGGEVAGLSDEEVEALREMLGMFRAIRNLLWSLGSLASGKPPAGD